MRRAIQAIAGGAAAVAHAPVLIVIVYVAFMVTVMPAVALVAAYLENALATRTLDVVGPDRADTAWFERASEVTEPLLGTTFAPTMIGFAAQLSNIDDLARANAREPIAWVAVIAWVVLWTFLLGGILARYAGAAASRQRSFLAASLHSFARFLAIAAGTFLIYSAGAFAYRSVPPELRLWVLPMLVGVAIAVVLVTSYARARIALDDVNLRVALAESLRMVRAHPVAAATLALAACGGWIVLMGLLAWVDRRVGAGTGFWRPLLVAQAYVFARIILRLVWEASALSLVRMHMARSAK